MGREINQAGEDLIKGFEKLSIVRYLDEGGLWTIYWGHLIRPGEVFIGTEEEAEYIFRKDISYFETRVERLITAPLNDNQFAALVSFEYNTDGLFASTLRKRVNNLDYDVASEFMKWVKVKGVTSNGLIRRRKAEVALWIADT